MIDGIRQQLTYLDPSNRKAKAETGTAASSRAPSVALASSAQGAELVEISASMSSAASSAPIEKSRVEAIRDAIRRKEYPINFEKLAERMIETDLGFSLGK